MRGVFLDWRMQRKGPSTPCTLIPSTDVGFAPIGSDPRRRSVATVSRMCVDRQFPTAYVGGAFNAGELLLAPMRDTVKVKAPQAVIGPPQRTPVEGAAMMAIRAAAAPRSSRSRV